jgi:glycerol kinase
MTHTYWLGIGLGVWLMVCYAETVQPAFAQNTGLPSDAHFDSLKTKRFLLLSPQDKHQMFSRDLLLRPQDRYGILKVSPQDSVR